MGVSINYDSSWRSIRTRRPNSLHLGDKHRRVHDDTGTQKTFHPWTKDATRQETQGGLRSVDHDCVTGVVSALKANHPISLLGEDINELSFALISPLSAHDNNARHRLILRMDYCRNLHRKGSLGQGF
jgi:hypothetical protein